MYNFDIMTIPEVITVDMEKETRAVIYDDGLKASLPGLQESFNSADSEYERIKADAPDTLAGRLMEINLGNKASARASLIVNGDSSKSTSALVIFSPFADCAPETSGSNIARYTAKSSPNILDKHKYLPHSWNQTTKSHSIHNLLLAEGIGMPVITIFSPIPPGVYDKDDRDLIQRGDFIPAAYLAQAAVAESVKVVQDYLHGTSGETKIRDVHLYGASLGAHNALGAGRYLDETSESLRTMSITTQELILGPSNLRELFRRYTRGLDSHGEKSEIDEPEDATRLQEPLMRREIDGHGNEVWAYTRTLGAMAKLVYMRGLTNPYPSRLNFYEAPRRAKITIANAVNSGITAETDFELPDPLLPRMHMIRVQALRGQYAGHKINEHVGLSSTVALLGIKRSLRS